MFSAPIIHAMHEQMERLYKATQERFGISDPSDLARALGVTHQVVTNWQSRGISKDGALTAQGVLGISATWIKDGTGDMFQASVKDVSIPSEDDFDLVPQLDMSAACGDGKFAEHVVVKGGLAFKKSFMRQFGITEATGRVIYAEGVSMEPTIGNGRVVLVNLADSTPQDGKVFLICDQDGALILKRLVREYDPTIQETVWKTRSDNPDKRQYPDKILPMDSRVKIVGRAIWHDGLL